MDSEEKEAEEERRRFIRVKEEEQKYIDEQRRLYLKMQEIEVVRRKREEHRAAVEKQRIEVCR